MGGQNGKILPEKMSTFIIFEIAPVLSVMSVSTCSQKNGNYFKCF